MNQGHRITSQSRCPHIMNRWPKGSTRPIGRRHPSVPGMIAHQVSDNVPSFAGSLMDCIYFIGSSLAHKPRKEFMRLMRVEALRFSHRVPEIFHVLLQARRMTFSEFVRMVHVRVWNVVRIHLCPHLAIWARARWRHERTSGPPP